MRVALFLTVILALGFLGPTDALCDLKLGDTAICHKLDDIKFIDSQNLTALKASVQVKTLTSIGFKNLPPSIKSLDLSDGEIEVIEPGAFHKMTGLVNLKLSDNFIAQLKDSALDGLQKLKHLDLRRNNIRQLPLSLTKLKTLKNLEISGNPITCNCATLRARDNLLANAVKISEKVFCVTPFKFKGVSLLKPEAEVICMLEEQDAEMQADQAAGSGDAEDELLDDSLKSFNLVPVPVVHVSDEPDLTPEIIRDDLIIPVLGRSGTVASLIPLETSTQASSNSDSSSSSTSSVNNRDDFEFGSGADGGEDSLIVEASGLIEPEEEGSGEEGSGIDYISERGGVSKFDKIVEEENGSQTSTTEQPTTSTMSGFGAFWYLLTGDSGTTTQSSDTEKSLTEEEFMAVSTEESTTLGPAIVPKLQGNGGNVEVTETVVTEKASDLDTAVAPSSDPNIAPKFNKGPEDFSPAEKGKDSSKVDEDSTTDDQGGAASTHQPKKSLGSYVVLAALLGVLAALVGFAAYKSSFCKKKPSSDPEQGSELKDIRKALLDNNSTNQPKIAANGGGNTENIPLVEPSTDTWVGPQEIRQWTDNSAPTLDSGAKYTPSVVESDPIKPPRKSVPSQEETNGLQEVKTHSPLSTFAPRTHETQSNSVTPPNSSLAVVDDGNPSPPLSPNAQRVKITLQENPDSVPKTPILITRTRPGVNLVKTP